MTFSGFNIPNFNPMDYVPKDLIPKDLRQKIQDHMGKDPSSLPIVTEQFERHNYPNLQLALDQLTELDGRTSIILGIHSGFMGNFTGTALQDIVSPKSMAGMVGLGGAKEGPVQYLNVELDGQRKLPCLQGGLYLISGKPNLVVLLRQQTMMDFAGPAALNLDVMAEDRSTAEEFIQSISRCIGKHNVYRGKILSVEDPKSSPTSTGLRFHTLPEVDRDRIILPEGLLKRVERQSIEVGKYSESLRKANRKLKRGILLHGKPGTGKTLTAMYLASAMKERTVLVLVGRGQGYIERCCKFARWLAPSMVIIEDVDLIAEERSQQQSCSTSLLFELLNEMDGLSDDCDVLFLLTTNRPEILEPALAARPGRVDQAFEIPLPDAEGRRKLFDLYGIGLKLNVSNMDSFVQRTNGASGAFISELMRKAALFAAPEGDPIVVEDRHLDEAMHELVVVGGALTKNLLGFQQFSFHQ